MLIPIYPAVELTEMELIINQLIMNDYVRNADVELMK